MTRMRYGLYLSLRVAEVLLIVTMAVICTLRIEQVGWIHLTYPRGISPMLCKWLLPLLVGAVAHILVGPKQRRPVFHKIAGAMYVYAGIPVSLQCGLPRRIYAWVDGVGKNFGV